MGKKGPKSINIINKAKLGSAMQNGVNPPMLDSQGVPMAPSSPAKIVPFLVGAGARALIGYGLRRYAARQGTKWLAKQGLKKVIGKGGKETFKNIAKGTFAKGPTATNWAGQALNVAKSFVSPGSMLPKTWSKARMAVNAAAGIYTGMQSEKAYASWGSANNNNNNSIGGENDGKLDDPSNKFPMVNPPGVTHPTPSSGSYVKPGGKATGSMKDYAIGSDARKAEYDARGWKYDDTIKGYDRKGNKLNAAPDNRTAPKPNNNAWIKVNESKKVSNKVNNEISNVKVPDVPKVNANQSDNASNVSRKQIPFENPTNRKQIRVNKQFRKATGMDKKDIKTAKLEEKMNISGDGLGGRILSNRVINRYNRGMEAQVNVSPDKKPVGIKQDVKPVLEVKKQEVQKLAVDPIKVDVSSLKPRGEVQTVEQANKAQDELDLKGTPFKRRGCGPRGLGSQYK